MSVEFVDTNVLAYAYDQTAGAKRERARLLVATLWRNRQGALSIQVLQEFYAVVTRKLPIPMGPGAARERIRNLSRWRIAIPSVADVCSFCDALIIRTAQNVGASILWSDDLHSGQVFGRVEIRNPFGPSY